MRPERAGSRQRCCTAEEGRHATVGTRCACCAACDRSTPRPPQAVDAGIGKDGFTQFSGTLHAEPCDPCAPCDPY